MFSFAARSALRGLSRRSSVRPVAGRLVSADFIRNSASMALQKEDTRFELPEDNMKERVYKIPEGGIIRSISPSATLLEVSEAMCKHRIGSLVVTDKNRLVLGIITERDLVYALRTTGRDNAVAGEETVETWMTGVNQLIVAREHADMAAIMAKMRSSNVRHMPILSKSDRLIRIVSIKDVQSVVVDKLEDTLKEMVPLRIGRRHDV